MIRDYPLKTIALPGGETLAYREAGAGEKTLLLIHGNMSSSLHYDLLIEQLERQYKLYAVDLRGFGSSTYNQGVESLRDFARDVAEFVQAKGIGKFYVAGWSTGGGVALELAADLPDQVEGVILIESVGVMGYPMFKKDAAGQLILDQRLRTREEIAADPVQVLPILRAYATGNREMLRAIWNAAIYTQKQPEAERYERYLDVIMQQRNLVDVDYALVTFNMTDEHNGVVSGSQRLDLVKGPVLVIHGDKDMVVPLAFSQQTAQKLGDRATLAIIPGVGHSPLTDNLPELVRLITEFID